MQSENLRPGVTLEWPKASAFKLSYTDISVYSLQLRNTNRKPVAVDITFSAPGCLLRPTRFLVPGYRAPADPPPRTATTNPAAPADPATSTTLTLAIQPGFTFEREAFQRTETLLFLTYQRHFTNELNECKSPGDLNYLVSPFKGLPWASTPCLIICLIIPPTFHLNFLTLPV